ncbi:MAG: acetylornithine transaminase [Firmicutes bacterium]|jgi:acetylornithine/N-succinyldiaminopimelate aminotransferase|nr:acetylornithine transaminase [Bacillota bacterium]
MEYLKTTEVKDLTRNYIMNTYRRAGISLVKGSGARVWDAEGKEYLDFLSGISVCGLGHCHPKIVAAIQEQAGKLMHCSNLYHIQSQACLAQALLEGSPFDKAFFCNSGTEANEAAIKLARKYAKVKHGVTRSVIVTALKSFHGRTLGSLTATGQMEYHKDFGPLLSGFKYVPFNDIPAIEQAVTPETAAVLLEPIQGEGGVHVPDKDYFGRVREICDKVGAILIMDEVQTGMGRTGKMFAFEHFGIEPDAITLAKSLGGGFPIGALLAKDDIAQVFSPGTHATTFGGNPLACTAALAVLNTMDNEGILEHVATASRALFGGLEKLKAECPHIAEIRGLGLMVGIEVQDLQNLCTEPPAKLISLGCLNKGLLVNAVTNTTVRLLPPLIVGESEIKEALDIVGQVLNETF